MTIKRQKFQKGVRILKENIEGGAGAEDLTLEGEIGIDANDEKVKVRLDSATRAVVTEDQAQTLTNKTIDATAATGTNTISIDSVDAVFDDSTTPGLQNPTLGATTVQGALEAVKTRLDSQNDANEISYDNTTSGLTASNVQAAIDEVEGRVDTIESATYVNSFNSRTGNITPQSGDYDATLIGYDNTTSGLSATTAQSGIDEVTSRIAIAETSIGSNNLAIDGHIAEANGAHAASAISYDNSVTGLTATQTQDAIDEVEVRVGINETNILNHVPETSGVHGVTGNVVGTTDSQTISNKTITTSDIDGGTASNTSRITIPKDTKSNLDSLTRKEATIVYASDENKAYIDDGTTLQAIGSGGQGGINYLEGSDSTFDVSTGGWTSSNANLAISRQTVSPLRGEASLEIEKDTINLNGETVRSPVFTIDDADLAKKLTISFDYSVTSLYSDGEMLVEIIQDPNGTPVTIRPNGEEVKATSGTGTHYAQFQTDASVKEYQLRLKVNTTDGDAFIMKVDNVKVGPTNLAFGTVVTDWQDYTATLTNFTANFQSFAYRRVGDSLEITGWVDINSVSGDMEVSLPPGLVIDSAKLARSSFAHVGQARALKNNISYDGIVITTLNNTLIFGSSGSGEAAWDIDKPVVWANGDDVDFFATVPIQGWSSNAQMSEDLGGREVRVEGRQNGGATLTVNTTNIDFTEVTDITSSWDGSIFTVPETGDYLFEGAVIIDVASGSRITAYVNGSPHSPASDDNSSRTKKISFKDYLTRGDTVSFRSNGADTLTSSNNNHYLTITKLASPQTILETETVAARYTSNSGQLIANNTVVTAIYEDLTKDTHGSYNVSTGVYTISVSGWYMVNVNASLDHNFTAGSIFSTEVRKNNTAIVQETIEFEATGTFRHRHNPSTVDYFDKGDEVTVIIFQNSGTDANLSTANTNNHFSIARIK